MTYAACIALAVIAAIVIAIRGWMADNAPVRAEVAPGDTDSGHENPLS